MSREELDFKNGNPGAVQHGNFINYYQFHPPENRIKLLPNNFLQYVEATQTTSVLDIGCNSGDLTAAVYEYFLQNSISSCKVLGIDIDPLLIERARENNVYPDIRYEAVDVMNHTQWENFLTTYQELIINKFDITFCFSVTMWIHLNNGDDGLKSFLKKVSKITNILIIEPQPWKCYRNAVKRLKLAKANFPFYEHLEIRENIENYIIDYLVNDCGMKNICETGKTEWGRKIVVFSSNRV